MSQSQRVLQALNEAVRKLKSAERAKHEPIAIVGMGCRFPQADDLDSYWQLLCDGVDAINDVPASRWSLDEWYDPDAPDKHTTRHGGFLNNVTDFDPHFFGIAPREAVSMDPQQRILLEVAYEAVEQAGLTDLKGKQGAVFIGVTNSDYAWRLMNAALPLDVYFGTGNTRNVLSGRLSYWLGLQGASMVVDTACSSSLVAVHLACAALRQGECELALAGGVNLILSPEVTTALSHASMLAPDGRCKTFSESADGFVRSEGCGVIVLKRLSDALANGDNILATIRGSAVNQDGASSGLTAPNGIAQRAVIRQALAQAKVTPSAVQVIEAHGTGTSLGDPIEVQALAHVYGEARRDPLWISSVKTNIGHAESAAGIAGLIKLVLSLQNETIPPHLHFDQPNQHIDWDNLPVAVPTTAQAWTGKERLAGVSSFGISGTNAHILLGSFDADQSHTTHAASPQLLTFSAKTDGALRELAQRYQTILTTANVADVARAAAFGRSHLPYRLALVADNSADATEQLQAFLDRDPAQHLHTAIAARRRKVAFLFTGQGGQHAAMGRDLSKHEPVFRAALDECKTIFKTQTGRELRFGIASDPDSQPALFALQYALVQQWTAWGVAPDLILGHSVGEIAAACVAGVFDVADGLKIAEARGRLVAQLPPTGAMMAVFTSAETVQTAIQSHNGSISIAAYNAPDNVVITGDASAVATVAEHFQTEAVRIVSLPLNHAFHSAALTPAVAPFAQVLATVNYQPPKRKIVSTVTGDLIGAEMASADYWIKNLLQPVQFERAIGTLNVDTFLEISPTPTLITVGQRCLPESDALWLASLHKDKRDHLQMRDALAAWHVNGGVVKWEGVFAADSYNPVTLPTYPFQRDRYWVDPAPPKTTATPITQAIAAGDVDGLFARLVGAFESAEHDTVRRTLAALIAQQKQGDAALDWLYKIDWINQPRTGWMLPPTFLPTPADLKQTIAPYLTATEQRDDVQAYVRRLDALDQMAVGYIAAAMRELDQFSVAPKHARFVERLKAILKEATTEKPIAEISDSESTIEQIILTRCGENLAAVLRDDVDPLTLLFPEDGRDSAEILYQHAFGATLMNDLLAQTLQAALATLPAGRSLRVLEIGAGTGGTTAAILPLLPATHTSYTFTDISTAFTRQSAEKFADYPFIDYRRLDIEQDPATQGFDGAQYDLIIAANVLHATRNLPQTLLHTRQLLAPNGQLFLIEGTARMRWVDLVFGMTEGWWHFADAWRTDHALISAETWQKILPAHGFTQATALATAKGAFSRQAVIVAQAPAIVPTTEPKHWVIVGNGIAAPLSEQIHTLGHRTTQRIAADAPDGILFLADAPDGDPFDAAQAICEPLLKLVQDMARQNWSAAPRLAIVTSNSAAPSDLREATQALLWGMRRVIGLEHPEFRPILLDLDNTFSDEESAAALLVELLDAGDEEEILLRAGGRFVPRLIREEAQEQGELPIKPNQTYLITGGLGGVGLLTADWLAQEGATHLVLLGRSKPKPVAADVIQRLEQRGVTVTVAQADVSNGTQMQAVLDALDAPLCGVIHAAGTLDDGILQQQTWQRFIPVLAAKVAGAWQLHQLTAEIPLDFFVLFSSTVGLFGNAGQSNHAAASAFLDSFAHYRRNLGLPAQVIDWGAWKTVGAAAERSMNVRAMGAEMIESADGIQALATIMRQSTTQVAAVPINWSELPPSVLAKPLFANFARATQPQDDAPQSFADQLAAAPAHKQRDVILAELRRQLAVVLGVKPAHLRDLHSGFFELGMDSLTAVELRNNLQKSLGQSLPTTLAFDYPTLATLLDYISSLFVVEEAIDAAPELDDPATDDLAALLDAELAELGV